MPDYKVVDLVSLITFTFGALAFFALVAMYFRQRQAAAGHRGSRVLAAFTAVCAAALVANLTLEIVLARAADSPLVTWLSVLLDFITCLLPPMVFHLIYTKARRRAWAFWLVALYAASAASAVAALRPEWLDLEWLNSLPAVMLGVCAGSGLAAQWLSPGIAVNHSRWNQGLLAGMMACSALNVVVSNPLTSILPDYLLLAFFCVTLYYEERLMFFDLLIKRGAFFAVALLVLPVVLMAGFRLADSPADWTRCWIYSLLLAPFWLIAPWTYRRIEAAIDRGWLRRRFSIPDAEQRFIRDVQIAATEEDLRSRAATSFREIFQAPACVSFKALERDAAESVRSLTIAAPWVTIEERPDGMPFLSDDRRLLQSLGRTLGMVLENVRFREREHNLRWLATRAELKALRAQMNPHFLFNALNAIAGLIEEQPRLADETIEQLAHVLRYALRQSDSEWVRLDEEIDFLTAYLRVEQARFGERLQVEFGIDRSAASVPVPAMTIQPLVENAIKHGISAVEGAGRVGVNVTLHGELLCVAVSDNGPGFPRDFSIGAGGHGLRNVADRIAGYYGEHAQLSWECGIEGTRVFLKIPSVAKNGNHAHLDRG